MGNERRRKEEEEVEQEKEEEEGYRSSNITGTRPCEPPLGVGTTHTPPSCFNFDRLPVNVVLSKTDTTYCSTTPGPTNHRRFGSARTTDVEAPLDPNPFLRSRTYVLDPYVPPVPPTWSLWTHDQSYQIDAKVSVSSWSSPWDRPTRLSPGRLVFQHRPCTYVGSLVT